MRRARIAVLVSGGGTNLQALIDAERAGAIPHGEIVLVVSSKPGVYALERAAAAGIPSRVVSRREAASQEAFEDGLLAALREAGADLVVLAGFLSILGPRVIAAYPDRIINVHPSLIPSFCGAGFYGLRVHEAALSYGVKVTGATVHLVNEIPDGGRILMQRAVDILPGDTPETLQRRVMEEAEWKLLPAACELMAKELTKE
ncbi:MAG: phosphoribosylglycinamide formyltransferase [Clostridia bacterium]|nr:phosphoribosylglycinamide formyltransferase [Clostridia bacterium]